MLMVTMEKKNYVSELKNAVVSSDLPSIQKLLSDGADVNGHCDGEENSVLHYASNLDVVNELLKHGACVNVLNRYHETPLDTFVNKFHGPDLVEALLKRGADVNVITFEKENPLSELKYAVVRSDLPSIQKLLSDGADVNGHCDDKENSVLHYASNLDVVKELLKHGADVNVQNMNLETPLHTFVKKFRSPELLETLLKHGANVNDVNRRGNTPLNSSLRQCRYSPINYPEFELLLSYGADVTIKNQAGDSPLDNALSFNSAEYLIKLFCVHSVTSFCCSNSVDDYQNEFEHILKLNDYRNRQGIYNCIRNHLNKCIPEIIEMKNDMTLGSTSVFDFINERDINMVYLYFSKKKFEKVKNEIKRNYSVYQELIMTKIDKCLKSRETILHKVQDLRLFTLSYPLGVDRKQRIVLNTYCTRIIVEFLSNFDVQNVFKVFNNLDTKKSEKLDDMGENIVNPNVPSEVTNDNVCTSPPECSVSEIACKRMKFV